MSSSEDEELNSEASSYDSEEYGAVARSGYTRMYILSYSSLSATDQSHDEDGYYGEEEEGDIIVSRQVPPVLLTEPKHQLIYTNGRQVYHGAVELPEEMLQTPPRSSGGRRNHRHDRYEDEDDDDDEDEELLEQREQDLIFSDQDDHYTSRMNGTDIGLCDIPSLVSFFQDQKQKLDRLKDVLELRACMRDVFYQMEEVAEFMCEELSKDKNIDRIEQASKEFHWICDEKNPTFFELQTYKQTNASLKDAGIQLVVMKTIVRDVLLDILFYQDSYYVSLRENTSELVLEETFIPNMSCMGPCFLVRRYNDADLYKLILWCSLPALSIEGLQLPLKNDTTTTQQPLKANNTQLYCVLQQHSVNKKLNNSMKKKSKQQFHKVDQLDIDPWNFGHEEDDDQESKEQEDKLLTDHDVFLQFNEYCYFGSFPVCTRELDDVCKLTTKWIPHLRSQVDHLNFQCHVDDLKLNGRFHSIIHLFQTFFAPKLVELILSSEKWLENLITEMDTASYWVGPHIKKWLDNEDGKEFFFELELDKHIKAFEQVDLLLWKGIVHHAWLMVIYRRGSFYLVLRDAIASEENDTNNTSMMLLDAFFPTLGSKGRGYLIQQFNSTPKDSWLHKARLTLWQTAESIDQEIEVTNKALSATGSNNKTTSHSSDWFATESDLSTESDSADFKATTSTTITKSKEKKKSKTNVKSHHHLAPMKHQRPLVQAPWDVKTGKPLFQKK